MSQPSRAAVSQRRGRAGRDARVVALIRSALVPSGALLWDERADHRGRVWRVYLCDPLATSELGLAYAGRCIFDGLLILLSAATTRGEQDENFWHEWTHVAYDDCGTLPERQEEAAVEPIAAHGLVVAQSLGLRIPPRPPGLEALERQARARLAAFTRLYAPDEA